MERVTLTGTLHVLRQMKRSRSSNILERFITDELVAKGLREGKLNPAKYEYAPVYWMSTDRTIERKSGTPWRYMYRFRGRPKAFDRTMEGWRVVVRATPEEWPNRLGAYLNRPQVLSVERPICTLVTGSGGGGDEITEGT